ncbi:DUF4031 domain-containing protein [Kineococcus sp. R8]|nr:DUF4031 domain-containing protein [Kineococcus siccus]NAZ83978.1 DUF4031 domain-containing protein [Kineococcus siccus]
MTVLVDAARYAAHGRLWAHLVSDTSLEELHAFAAALGLPERSFEGDHYDVPADRVADAVRAGARPITTREVLVRLRAAGLRTPKRRGEKVLASTPVTDGGPVHRVDLVRGAHVPGPCDAHLVVTADGEQVAVVTDVGGRRVLGFRRTWSRTPEGVRVRHEGVLLAGPADGAPAAGRSAAAPAWCRPLLP